MSAAAVVRRFAKSALTENIGLKLVALIASAGLFINVHGTEDRVATIPVRLERPESETHMLISELPDRVQVTVSGPASIVNALERDGLPAIEMLPEEASERFFYINPDRFESDLPTGVRISQVAPGAIPLVWVERAERRLPIEPILAGHVARDHLVLGTFAEPATVMVRGPRSEIERMESARTGPVDVDGLGAGEHDRHGVPLAALPRNMEYLDLVAVDVHLTVEPEVASREFADLEVVVLGTAAVRLRPAHIDVHVAGPRGALDSLQERRIIPFVDVTTLSTTAGAQPIPVQLRPLPDGFAATADPAELLAVPVP